MIISDESRFAFVHIPKNAGTTIRAQLSPIDDRNGFYAALRADEQGIVYDYSHLTLAQLSRLYPAEFQRLNNYTTFCLVRDPAARFDAAVSEYAKQYLRRDIATFSRAERLALIKDLIEKLNYFGTSELPYWLVWFTPQTAFIEWRGKRVIPHVFPVDNLSGAVALTYEKTGILLDTQERKNQRVDFRNNAIRRAVRIGRHARRFLPKKLYTKIRQPMRAMLLESARNSEDRLVKEIEEKEGFVKEFYLDDYAIWREALLGEARNWTNV